MTSGISQPLADSVSPSSQQPTDARRAAFALGIAALAGGAVVYEACITITFALAWDEPLPQALFRFVRFFTIETNSLIALTMGVTGVRALAGRAPPRGRLFDAAVVYALVTCLAYEILLRPTFQGVTPRFVAGVVLHDIVPLLTLMFWWVAAPKEGRRKGDILPILIFPISYFVLVLTAGAFGQGYPYGFLDVDRLGPLRVCLIGLAFLGVFALLAQAACHVSARQRS